MNAVLKSANDDSANRAFMPLPHNIEAEQGLLAALLVDNRAVERLPESFRANHFYAPAHQRIFKAIADLTGAGMVASPVTLKNFFEKDNDLSHIGGAGYLGDLAACAISIVNVPDYARQITDLFQRRELIDRLRAAEESARRVAIDNPGTAVLENLETELFALAERGQDKGPVALLDGIGGTMRFIEDAQAGRLKGLKTGIGALDRMIHIMPTDLVIVGGRPGMGKSVFGLTAAYNAALSGSRVLLFSLEMGFDQLTQRMLGRITGLPAQMQQRENSLSKTDWDSLIDAQRKLSALPLAIDDSGGLDAAQIRARARRHKRRFGLDVIIVDYLGMMDLGDKYVNKNDQLGEISRALKTMAKELEVPVILLAQLNRGVEGRENKRPQLSDLRESGNLEQDADIVMFLYREEKYLEHAKPVKTARDTDEKHTENLMVWENQCAAAKGRAEIIVSKFRQGQTGTAYCGFDGMRQCFYDLEG